MNRLKLAQNAHRVVKNLTFVDGNSNNFEGIGSENYDIIFLNHVLHWIPNKQHAFENMFSSLKPGGKIAIQYVDALSPFEECVLEKLNPETEERIKNAFHGSLV